MPTLRICLQNDTFYTYLLLLIGAFSFLFVCQEMPCGAVLLIAEGTDGDFLFVRMSLYALSVSKSRRMKRKGRRRKNRGGFPGFGSNKMTFCQTNRSTVPVFAPKSEAVTGKGLLGRFAKSTLMPFERNRFPFGYRIARQDVVSDVVWSDDCAE